MIRMAPHCISCPEYVPDDQVSRNHRRQTWAAPCPMILEAPSMAECGRCCPGKTGVLEGKKDLRIVLIERLFDPGRKRQMDLNVVPEAEAEYSLALTFRA